MSISTSNVKLYQPPRPGWGRIPNMSPFCVKLETYLKAAKIPYTVHGGNPMRAPKGKIPFVVVDGKKMGDSGLIIEELKRLYGDPLDAHLTNDQRAIGHALRRMIEESTYFAFAYRRWANPVSFAYVEALFKPLLPSLAGGFILKKLRKSFLQRMHGQGIAKHSDKEILSLATQDLETLNHFLSGDRFIFGEQLTSFDCCFFAFLIQTLWVPWDCEEKHITANLPNLSPYTERVWNAVWA